MDQYARTELLLGREAIERLHKARVAVFGLGGVGGYVCEALARSGVGFFDLIDNDTVSLTNLNRQIIATRRTIGVPKTEAMRGRIHEIDPEIEIRLHNCFFLPETAEQFRFEDYDYVVDAVDTVTAKIALILQCQAAGTPIISSMGAGNKLDPTAFRVADIYRTKADPLARVMRRELKKRGVKKLKVVYSEEEAMQPIEALTKDVREELSGNAGGGSRDAERRALPGSTAFVPSVAGLIIAGEVVKDLTGIRGAADQRTGKD